MTFGEKLSSLRKQANLTQSDLANKLNVSRQAIIKWEKSIGLPDLDNIKKISTLFNVSIEQLIDYKIETIELQLDSTTETINKKNSKLKNVDNFVLEKFKNAQSIYKLYAEPNWGFWKSLFYSIFDIDIAVMTYDLMQNGLTFCYLIEKNNNQYLIAINKSTLYSKKLTEPFNKKEIVIDGYKYTKLEDIKNKKR